MGVSGLLSILKEIQDTTSLERYRGQTLAVDTYGWLHRALVLCSQELCQDLPTRKYITSVMNKVQMLQHFDITPYFVFDGGILPTKKDTLTDRRVKREESLAKANALMLQNKNKLAVKEFMKAACVTPQMAKSVMVELDKLGIKYVVAPYEADPQMVYLEKQGIVDGILSEDSDLLVFGCTKLITKLKDDSSCVEIDWSKISSVKSIPYLTSLSAEQIRLVVMLSGCDYTKGVPGIGLKTAFALVKKHQTLEKVLAALRADNKTVPPAFEEEVQRANLAFQYQKVFDPRVQAMTTLNEYVGEMDMAIVEMCCGETVAAETIVKVCRGLVHPSNHNEQLVTREQALFDKNFKKISRDITPRRSIVEMMRQPTRAEGTSTNESKRVAIETKDTKVTKETKDIKERKETKEIKQTIGKISIETKEAIGLTQKKSVPMGLSQSSSASQSLSLSSVLLPPPSSLKRHLSPTSKKISRINPEGGSPVRQSKFFKNTLKQKSLPVADFEKSFEVECVSLPVKVIPTEGIDTDEDDVVSEEDKAVHDSEEDDEIEESPVKTKVSLMSRFAFKVKGAGQNGGAGQVVNGMKSATNENASNGHMKNASNGQKNSTNGHMKNTIDDHMKTSNNGQVLKGVSKTEGKLTVSKISSDEMTPTGSLRSSSSEAVTPSSEDSITIPDLLLLRTGADNSDDDISEDEVLSVVRESQMSDDISEEDTPRRAIQPVRLNLRQFAFRG